MACILLCSVLIALDMEKWRMLQFQSQLRMVLIVVGTRCQDRVLPAPCHAPRLIGAEVSTSYRGHHCSWPAMNDMIIASCDKKEIWFNKVDKNRTRNVNTFNWSDSIRPEWRLVFFQMPWLKENIWKREDQWADLWQWPVTGRWPLPVWGAQVPSPLLGPCSLDVLAGTTQLRLAKYISTGGIVHSVNTIRWNAEIPGLLFASNLG